MPVTRKGRRKLARRPPSPRGAPSKYRPEYCDMLVKHLGDGQTVESFGALVGVCRDTVWEWAKVHPQFSDAKKVGEAKRELFLVRMMQGIALGQHRRVVSERTVTEADGRTVTTRVYAPAHTSAAAAIFMCKNMLKWRDKQDIAVSGDPAGAPVQIELSRAELIAEIEQMARVRHACGDD